VPEAYQNTVERKAYKERHVCRECVSIHGTLKALAGRVCNKLLQAARAKVVSCTTRNVCYTKQDVASPSNYGQVDLPQGRVTGRRKIPRQIPHSRWRTTRSIPEGLASLAAAAVGRLTLLPAHATVKSSGPGPESWGRAAATGGGSVGSGSSGRGGGGGGILGGGNSGATP
jgi:hypothetical protein